MSSNAGLALPKAAAWFRFASGTATHLGAVVPADGAGSPAWFDLGAQDVHGLLQQGALRREDLAQRIAQGRPMPAPDRFAVPVPRPGKILCLAKNYVAHAKEFGAEPPSEPIFFAKLPDCLLAAGQAVVIPHWLESRVDHEAELGLVLGFADPKERGARYPTAEQAPALVAGYTVLNDVTARKLQGQDRDARYPWLRSKALDTFCPVGPFVVPADAIDASDLPISMTVNGQLRQQARTSDMVFSIEAALVAMGRCTTLRPGDLIAMGTPEGVGPIEHGDTMVATVDGLGQLQNTVTREPRP